MTECLLAILIFIAMLFLIVFEGSDDIDDSSLHLLYFSLQFTHLLLLLLPLLLLLL